MDKYSKCILGRFSNEDDIALTVQCLNTEYPNVLFEAVETGTGSYELSVVSKYGGPIYNSTLHVFKNAAWVLYKAIPIIQGIKS
jgi:hypothetical protein